MVAQLGSSPRMWEWFENPNLSKAVQKNGQKTTHLLDVAQAELEQEALNNGV